MTLLLLLLVCLRCFGVIGPRCFMFGDGNDDWFGLYDGSCRLG